MPKPPESCSANSPADLFHSLYDPAANTWSAAGSLATARQYHTATLLSNGKVLVAGGQGNSGLLASAEVFGVVATGAEGAAVTQTGTFSDPDGNATVTLSASTGTVTQNNAAGTWSWSPAAGFDGPSSSSVTITATDTSSATATAAFTFSPTNTAPTVAISAPATANEDASVNFTFTATDAAADQTAGFAWSLNYGDGTGAQPVTAGTASPLARTHAFTIGGTFTVTATATDKDAGTSTTATTSITIADINDAPTLNAIADPAAINEDAGLQTVSLAGISAGGGETQTLTVTATSSNTALIPNPTVTYTSPSATGSLSYTPVANASGTATVTVTVTDNGGILNGGVNTTSQTFTLTVNPVNDAPTGTNLSAAETYTEDTTLNLIDIVASDIDSATVTATLTLSNPTAGSLSTATSGAVTSTYVAGTGVWTASGAVANVNTLLAGVSFVPAADFNGSFSIATNVSDGSLSVSGSKAVTGIAVNDAPTLAAIGNPAAINEDAGAQTVSLSGIGTGAANETQTLVVTATSGNTALIANPAVTYTSPGATGTLTYTPVANANGTALVTVTVNDGGATNSTTTRTFTVTVLAVNDAPVVTGGTFTVPENSAAGTAVGTVTATDVDAGQTRTFAITAGNTGGAFAINSSTGAITVASAAALDYETTPSFTLTVQATDNGTPVLSGTGTVTVAVTNVNEAPAVAVNGGGGAAVFSTAGSLGGARYYHTATLLAGGKVLVAGGTGNSGFLASAELYDPAANTWSAAGSLATARDYHTATLLANGKVLVAGGSGNSGDLASAELYGSPAVVATGAEGSAVTQTGTFSDPDGNATVTLTASTGTVTQNNAAGTWSWSPAAGFDGPSSSSVTITATDTSSATATAAFTFSPTNTAPTVAISAPATANEDASVSFTFTATDAATADQTAGFAWSLDYGDGTGAQPVAAGTASPLAGTHTFANPGTFSVTATATDKDSGVSALASGSITIADVTPPETTITSGTPAANSTSATITFSGTDNVAVTSFEGSLDGAAYATVASPVSFSPLAQAAHTFNVRAKDAAGNVDPTPASVTWTVDTTAPVVTPPGNVTMHATSPAGAVVNYGAATATDAVTASPAITYSKASGTTFAPGATTVTATATDAAGNAGTATFTVTVTPLTPAELWRYTNFGTAENVGDAAGGADRDLDGVKNVLELAFGTDPNNGGSGAGALNFLGTFAGGGTIGQRGQPIVRAETIGAATDRRALFMRRIDYAAAGLTYAVEFTGDLSTWEASTATPVMLASDGVYEIVSVPYPSFVSGKQARYFRARVSLAP